MGVFSIGRVSGGITKESSISSTQIYQIPKNNSNGAIKETYHSTNYATLDEKYTWEYMYMDHRAKNNGYGDF